MSSKIIRIIRIERILISLFIHREFVKRLRDANKLVYLITGGFDCLIEPIATDLGIPLENMYANKLFFQYNGKYFR